MFIHLHRRGNVVLRWWRWTASECVPTQTNTEGLTEKQRRNKKEYIIRKEGRKRKETAQFSPIFKFLNASFSLFQTQHWQLWNGFLQSSNKSTIRKVRLWPNCHSTRTKQRVDDSGRCSFSCAPQQGQDGSQSVQRNASEPRLVTDGLEMWPNMGCVRVWPNLTATEAHISM